MCEIYTDVDGVFTADPRIVPTARKLDRISNEEMLELAACGSKVLHLRSVEYARRFDIPIHVRSSFTSKEGTLVTDHPVPEGAAVEEPIIAGVAHDRSEAKITVVGVPDITGKAAEIFTALAEAQINIDMIVQNVSATETGLTDISFTLPKADGQSALESLQRIQGSVGFVDPPVRRPDRQALARRRGDALQPRRLGDLLPGAGRQRGQHRDDLDLRDPHLGRSPATTLLDEAVRAVHTAFGLDSADG